MTTVRELHQKAMEYAHLAMIARNQGQFDDAIRHSESAFALEYQAAQLVPDGDRAEPTRSILYRGAASLAYQCNRYSEAIQLAGMGLSGNPSPKIKKDLLSILDQVKFATYLQVENNSLDSGEMLLAMQGNAVGAGVVLYREFKDRIEIALKLVDKTVQRFMQRKYQSGGRIASNYKIFEQAIAVPEAQNSFAMTLRLVRKEEEHQANLLVQSPQQVIDEIIDGVNLINNNQEEDLRQHINDENYYSNFVYLVRQIAPDGDKISHVNMSSATRGAALTRQREEIEPIQVIAESRQEPREYDWIEVEGILKYADDEFRTGEQLVGITINSTDKRLIKLRAGIDDLVEQFWKRRVRITGKTDGAYIYPTDIIPLEDD